MDAAIVPVAIAALSALISLVTAFGLEYTRRRSSRALELLRTGQQRELEQLKDELTRTRDAESKGEEALRLVRQYHNPLLYAAFDLQARIYNVIERGRFLAPEEQQYFRESTLFAIAQLLGWIEIIRRDLQFLDMGIAAETRALSASLREIQECFASTERWSDDYFIFRGHQRAIGELMLSGVDSRSAVGPNYECIGYVEFIAVYEASENGRWFERIGQAVTRLPGTRPERMVAIQHALMALVDQLDPESARFSDSRDLL